jgi:hypothetical protein
MTYHEGKLNNGTKDQRQLLNDTLYTPNGLIDTYVNAYTYEYTFLPKTIKETYKTATIDVFGPKRSNHSDIIRDNILSMYSINTSILSEIGIDSNGNAVYSDGESFMEKCIFTGYYKSFIPNTTWKPIQQSKPINKKIILNVGKKGLDAKNIFGNVKIKSKKSDNNITLNLKFAPPTYSPITLISKSGYYFSKNLPIKGMFLGYNDGDLKPETQTFWEKPRDGKKYFYNDRICENELEWIRSRNTEILSKNPLTTSDIQEYNKRPYSPVKSNFMGGEESVLYSTKTEVKSKIDQNKFELKKNGSYRKLIEFLAKNDFVDIKKMKNGIETPVLRRRIEQYGPNPLQHLWYMDFYDWRKYTTIYIPKNESKLEIFGFEKPNELVIEDGFSDHRSLIFNNFFGTNARGRFDVNEIDGQYFYTDTTYILDIYFALMELHLKSFSWGDIFKFVDSIPNFSSDWNDKTWSSLSKNEKNKKRFNELDIGLEPVWNNLKSVIDKLSEI